jgi:hypothetical protein
MTPVLSAIYWQITRGALKCLGRWRKVSNPYFLTKEICFPLNFFATLCKRRVVNLVLILGSAKGTAVPIACPDKQIKKDQ